MPYIPFYELLPAIAKMETRVITLLSSSNEFDLPEGEYAFVELYCNECDCRRVFLSVMKEGVQEPVAIISWGWETEQFYIEWYGKYDSDIIKEMKGSTLLMTARQSVISKNVLRMFNHVLLNDSFYTSRIKKHYDFFRKELNKNIHTYENNM